MKAFVRFLLRLLFRFRAYNEGVLNTPGPVLLIPNHLSWIDWLFLVVCLEPDWKFVVSSMTAQRSWLHRRIMLNDRTFPIDTTSPYAVKRMAEYMQGKGRLVLFAEGRLSRTGTLMKLYDGTGFLLHKTGARVITCYLRGAHRLMLSPNRDAKRLLPEVTVHFSEVLTPPKVEQLSTAQARIRLTGWLQEKLILQQFETEMQFGPPTILEAIIESARQRPCHPVLSDVNQPLTYRRLLVAAKLLAQQFEKLLGGESPRVGVLLPNVNATPVVLLSLWSLARVPALLNYSTGAATMLACARLAGLKQIITSRAFLERARLKIEPLAAAGLELIYVEDVRQMISGAQKLSTLVQLTFNPKSLVRRKSTSQADISQPSTPCPATAAINSQPDQTAVILFTSGSEGLPKGVELTHRNVLANVRQMLAVCDMQDWDCLFNALPIFHSFGLTVGTLLPLIRGLHVFLYPSPLHYRMVPVAFYERDCTIMLGTNTFLNGYARKANPQDFRSLRYLFAGAEKLQEATATTWARRFGVRILEGYGATECSPGISVNTPLALKYGSAGRLMPGMEYKLAPVDGVPEGGRLSVRGPNVMSGYLNPEANAAFQKLGGWYDTGDIVQVDEERFVFILGRLKRFAKISGEMVSLTAVEDALAGAFPKYGLRCQVAVVSRPDEHKGEVLIAATNEARMQLEEIRAALHAKGLPNLCVPREVKFIKEIPRLGTGKINHRELEKLI